MADNIPRFTPDELRALHQENPFTPDEISRMHPADQKVLMAIEGEAWRGEWGGAEGNLLGAAAFLPLGRAIAGKVKAKMTPAPPPGNTPTHFTGSGTPAKAVPAPPPTQGSITVPAPAPPLKPPVTSSGTGDPFRPVPSSWGTSSSGIPKPPPNMSPDPAPFAGSKPTPRSKGEPPKRYPPDHRESASTLNENVINRGVQNDFRGRVTFQNPNQTPSMTSTNFRELDYKGIADLFGLGPKGWKPYGPQTDPQVDAIRQFLSQALEGGAKSVKRRSPRK